MRTTPPRTVQIARVLLLASGLLVIGVGTSLSFTIGTATARSSDIVALIFIAVLTAIVLAAGGCHMLLAWRLAAPRDRARSLALALAGATAALAFSQLVTAAQAGQVSRLMMTTAALAIPVATIVLLARRPSVVWSGADRPAQPPQRPHTIVVSVAALVAIGAMAGLLFSGQFLATLVTASGTSAPGGQAHALAVSFVLFVGPLLVAAWLWSGHETARAISIVLGAGAIAAGSSAVGVGVVPFMDLLRLPLLTGAITVIVALSYGSSRAWCAGDVRDDSTA